MPFIAVHKTQHYLPGSNIVLQPNIVLLMQNANNMIKQSKNKKVIVCVFLIYQRTLK